MEAKEEAGQSPISCSPASPSFKKSGRRSMQKRVVSVPAGEVDGVRSKGGGETAPPSDSWAWRKYGQKPIKGSPYPRGYYRCSSSKGCPARKQVERSKADPTTFIVTYSSEHDHSWPFSRNNPQRHHESLSPSPADSATAAAATEPNSRTPDEENLYSSPTADQEDKLSDLMVEDPAGLILPEDFHWFAEVSSPSTTSPTIGTDAELFCGPVLRVAEANVVLFDDCDKFTSSTADEEEDGLFAGLGELPECSIVFRRGFLEQQWRGDGDRKRYGIEAEESGTAATSWCGSTR